MVIESLKAEIAALTEAAKEKGVPEKVVKTLKESVAGLQKLLDKAREAAKEAGYEEEGGEEEGAGDMATEGIDPHKVKPGHKMTKTTTVKHDAPEDGGDKEEEEDGDEPDPKDEKKDGDAEESRRVHIESLLKEAGIPKEIWNAERLAKVSLKEAKEIVAEKKALIDAARKAVAAELDMVPMGMGEPVLESDGGENLNSLFSSCAE